MLIHKILLILTHAILKTVDRVSLWWNHAKRCLSHFVHTTQKPVTRTKSSLQKLPIHLGIVINEDHIELGDVASLILWCITIGIPHISIYDYNGRVKRQGQQLCEAVSQRHTESQTDTESYTVTQQDHTLQVHSSNTGSHLGEVRLLDGGEGRQHLVHATRRLAEQVISQTLKCSEIQPEYVDQTLQAHSHWPDPELILQFGAVPSLQGYPPWQTRLTEIIHAGSLWGLDYSQLMHSLHRYSQTQQRFGK